MINLSLKSLITMTVIVLAFSTQSFANQREQIIETFITGTESKQSTLDSLFNTDVQLVNHYLSWENTDGTPLSINIEHLQNYFNYYSLKTREAYCESPFVPGNSIERTRNSIPSAFMEKMKSMFEFKRFYPDLDIPRSSRREMGIYQLCKFARLSFYSMPFDPAGWGRLDRNFEFENAFEVIDENCKPITKKILEDEFGSDLTLLTLPEDMNETRTCNGPDN